MVEEAIPQWQQASFMQTRSKSRNAKENKENTLLRENACQGTKLLKDLSVSDVRHITLGGKFFRVLRGGVRITS